MQNKTKKLIITGSGAINLIGYFGTMHNSPILKQHIRPKPMDILFE